MTTGVAHVRKRRYPYHLEGNVYVREKRVDEILNEEIEFIADLDASETLSSVSVDASGPTISAEAVASGQDATDTKVTFTVTGVGSATFTVVTSASRTLERRLRWDGTNDDLTDYT